MGQNSSVKKDVIAKQTNIVINVTDLFFNSH